MRKILFFVFLLFVSCSTQDGSYQSVNQWVCSNIDGKVDKSTDASLKDDFYLFVNKEKIISTFISPKTGGVDHLLSGINKTDENVNRMILSSDGRESTESQNIINLFCLAENWSMKDSLGIEPLRKIFSEIDSVNNLAELNSLLCSDGKYFLSTYYVDLNLRDNPTKCGSKIFSFEYMPFIWDSGEYLKNSLERMQARSLFLFSFLFECFEIDSQQIENIIRNAVSFEREIVLAITENEKPEVCENLIRYADLIEKNKDFYLFNLLDSSFEMDYEDVVSVDDENWFNQLVGTWSEDNFERIKDYCILRFLFEGFYYSDSHSFEQLMNLYISLGHTENITKQDFGIRVVSNLLPWSLLRAYIDYYEYYDKKELLNMLTEEITDSYCFLLTESEIIDDTIKTVQQDKINKISNWFLYPDNLDYYIGNDLAIGNYDEGESLVSAFIKCRNEKLNLLKRCINLSESYWVFSPFVSSVAFYDPRDNSICFTIVGLEGVYSSVFINEEVLATVGFAIGHELAHVFDYENFRETDSVVNYLNTIKPYDSINRGNTLISEFFADVCSMHCLLNIAKSIPNFNYDLFFRTYARLYCAKYSKGYSESLLVNDCHLLPYIRVNGVLQQFDEFIDYYDIKPGDGMYRKPEERIRFF